MKAENRKDPRNVLAAFLFSIKTNYSRPASLPSLVPYRPASVVTGLGPKSVMEIASPNCLLILIMLLHCSANGAQCSTLRVNVNVNVNDDDDDDDNVEKKRKRKICGSSKDSISMICHGRYTRGIVFVCLAGTSRWDPKGKRVQDEGPRGCDVASGPELARPRHDQRAHHAESHRNSTPMNSRTHEIIGNRIFLVARIPSS
uniref:Uncharacterized protein n=1 Tax=Vespula pensylvanica TaxID=30213 RepID=A0A834U7S2_VESPE|nr:hypothetical protein H0235_010560 [Vespula pensylvanica]